MEQTRQKRLPPRKGIAVFLGSVPRNRSDQEDPAVEQEQGRSPGRCSLSAPSAVADGDGEAPVELRGVGVVRQPPTEGASGVSEHGAELLSAWQRLQRHSAAIQLLVTQLHRELANCRIDCAKLGAAAHEAAFVRDGALAHLAQLSPQQVRVLRLAARGQTDREIAEELHVGRETVKSHLREAYRKLGIHSRAVAAAAQFFEPPQRGSSSPRGSRSPQMGDSREGNNTSP